MDGKNKIIQRILDDADNKGKDIISKASTDSQQLIDSTKSRLAEEQQLLQDKCVTDGQSVVANALSNAKLDINKYRLLSKQNMIDKVYADVASQLHSLPAKQYLALVTKLINTHAEQGELVTICAKDSKVITASYLDKFGMGLELNKQYGDFDGGIILSCQQYDKVLTLDRLVQDIRRTSDMNVAKILFEGE